MSAQLRHVAKVVRAGRLWTVRCPDCLPTLIATCHDGQEALQASIEHHREQLRRAPRPMR